MGRPISEEVKAQMDMVLKLCQAEDGGLLTL
jgi:hypothetical protein